MQDKDSTAPRHPAAAKFDHGPYEPELGSLPEQGGDRDDETVNKTGTTTIGIAAADGVVVATDKRASLGGRFVSNKNVQKVEQIHPTAALTLVGSVGGAQSFIRTLRSEASLYETRRDEPSGPADGTVEKMRLPATFAGCHDVLGPIVREQEPPGRHAAVVFDHLVDARIWLGHTHMPADVVTVEFFQERIVLAPDLECLDPEIRQGENRNTGAAQCTQYIHHVDPSVLPHPDFLGPVGVGGGDLGYDCGKRFAPVDPVVHPVQVYGPEESRAPLRADHAIIKSFGLPLDEDIADVEDHGVGGHGNSFLLCPAQ